jgi:hypothetical protein
MNRPSWQIEKILTSLTNNYAQLIRLPWYKIPQKLNLMRSSRQMALTLQVESNEFAKYQLKLKKERESFAPKAADASNQNPFRPYFFGHLGEEASLSLSEIRETVKHMTQIVSEKYLQYSTVFAAVVGGIIGAIITNIPFLLSIISKWFKN